MRLDAYYYGFEATGVAAVDVVLSAVACAGKAFHHTDRWTDDGLGPYEDAHRGATPRDWIQNAAIDAAAEMTRLREENARLREGLRRVIDADCCGCSVYETIARETLEEARAAVTHVDATGFVPCAGFDVPLDTVLDTTPITVDDMRAAGLPIPDVVPGDAVLVGESFKQGGGR